MNPLYLGMIIGIVIGIVIGILLAVAFWIIMLGSALSKGPPPEMRDSVQK